jgi:hypothetical protein
VAPWPDPSPLGWIWRAAMGARQPADMRGRDGRYRRVRRGRGGCRRGRGLLRRGELRQGSESSIPPPDLLSPPLSLRRTARSGDVRKRARRRPCCNTI